MLDYFVMYRNSYIENKEWRRNQNMEELTGSYMLLTD